MIYLKYIVEKLALSGWKHSHVIDFTINIDEQCFVYMVMHKRVTRLSQVLKVRAVATAVSEGVIL